MFRIKKRKIIRQFIVRIIENVVYYLFQLKQTNKPENDKAIDKNNPGQVKYYSQYYSIIMFLLNKIKPRYVI